MVTKSSDLFNELTTSDPANTGRGTDRDCDQEKRLLTARLEGVGQEVLSIAPRTHVSTQLGSLVLIASTRMNNCEELGPTRDLLRQIPEVLKVIAVANKKPEDNSWFGEYTVHFQ